MTEIAGFFEQDEALSKILENQLNLQNGQEFRIALVSKNPLFKTVRKFNFEILDPNTDLIETVSIEA